MFLNDEGCLLRKADSGENHSLLVFFLKENGLKFALARRQAKPGSGGTLPDLFESGEVYLHQKDDSKPAFLKEFSQGQQFPAIARHYKTFTAAAALARFYERNLIHMENFEGAWELLHRALQSFAVRHEPEATLFKALFVFARMEGYAVQAQWLERRYAASRFALGDVLKKPVGDSHPDPGILSEGIRDLNRYFAEATDLLPAEL